MGRPPVRGYNDGMARPRRRNRSAEVLTISVLVALFMLLGLAALLWAAESGAFAPPTPTPTATPGPVPTTTPDFRATRTQEDMLTQIAYSVQLATMAAQNPGSAPGVGTPALVITLFPDLPAPPESAPTLNVFLPGISQADADAVTATAAALAAFESPLETPTPAVVALEPEMPPTPEAPPTQIVNLPLVDQGGAPTPTPSETPTLLPEPTATFTPTPIPPTPTATLPPPTATIPYTVSSLRAVVDRRAAELRVGPSSLYTPTGTLPIGTQITLLARDATGEWLFACCLASNTPGWMRGVSARPTENPTLSAPLSTEEANDVRWLPVRAAEPALTPIPQSMPPLAADWPMARHDQANSARVATLPRLPLQAGWPVGGQTGLAGQSFTSAAIVAGDSVLAASADGHLYSFDRQSGSQRWRYDLREPVRATPLAENGLIYLLTESGRLVALEDQGLGAVLRLDVAYGIQPHGGVIAAANRLLFTGRRGDGSEALYIADRGNGQPLRIVAIPGGTPQLPAVGGQLVYVASEIVRAIDIFSGEIVWQSADAIGFAAPPVYSTPGVEALAELYVADSPGRILAFDANTGDLLWATPIGGQATGLAVNASSVYASGPGFVRALVRRQRAEGQLLWNATLGGSVPGGVVADDEWLLAVTESGGFQMLDAVTGALIVGNVQSGPLGGAIAVSGPYIFAPTQSGILFAARESTP